MKFLIAPSLLKNYPNFLGEILVESHFEQYYSAIHKNSWEVEVWFELDDEVLQVTIRQDGFWSVGIPRTLKAVNSEMGK